ncbi:MAG TPA: glycerophosphodiester phosphodiesterase family protein, partial [Candidatus Hydrogenedentes bacterium]|nr:glycerophosphodiester phosphodiesterase family protein [Candidatus Hydrogenedentota bacterium]
LFVVLLQAPALEHHGEGTFLSPACGPRHGGVYVVAHRGAHQGIPENTLAAYRHAIELGADFVEIDLRETKDGRLVSMHNATVDAYTKDATGDVRSFTLAELKALDIGSRVGPEWAEERIPTFEEILEVCKGKIGIYLDLKHADVGKILALIHQYEMEKDIVWYAGTPQLRQVREQCPDCVPMPEIGSGEHLQRTVKLFAPKVTASTWKNLSEQTVKSCHEAGTILIVDDGGPESWDDMLAWGVDGIQTDDVDGLIDKLKKE